MTKTYEMADEVEILESGIIGSVLGTQRVAGDEDRYLVEYVDGAGTPTEKWWRASALSAPDESGSLNNVIPFPMTQAQALHS